SIRPMPESRTVLRIWPTSSSERARPRGSPRNSIAPYPSAVTVSPVVPSGRRGRFMSTVSFQIRASAHPQPGEDERIGPDDSDDSVHDQGREEKYDSPRHDGAYPPC